MYKVDVPIDFQQTLSNIYGEETDRMNYKALFRFTIIYRAGRNHSKILDWLIDLYLICYEN